MLLPLAFCHSASPAGATLDTGNEPLSIIALTKTRSIRVCALVWYPAILMACKWAIRARSLIVTSPGDLLVDVVVKFLKDNPSERHLPGVALAFRAFYVAFDCKQD